MRTYWRYFKLTWFSPSLWSAAAWFVFIGILLFGVGHSGYWKGFWGVLLVLIVFPLCTMAGAYRRRVMEENATMTGGKK